MKLYYSPGACSLSPHIVSRELGLNLELKKVDTKDKTVEDGGDYWQVNPRGYVPALVLDNGETLTENIAILDWVAHRAPRLAPQGEFAHTRLLEMLAFISSEVHKQFSPLF